MFLIIKSVAIMINAGVNAENWSIKEDVIKNLFGILLYTNVNDKSCNFWQYLDCENFKCAKKLIDKLIEK